MAERVNNFHKKKKKKMDRYFYFLFLRIFCPTLSRRVRLSQQVAGTSVFQGHRLSKWRFLALNDQNR
jgi:hypothetical protein